jgi:Cof subfamily protein (haloacid dehalogenase superfamily)
MIKIDRVVGVHYDQNMKLPESLLCPRLIALDLDDTLLRNDLSISDRTVAVLRECAHRNIYVTLCSGRTEDGMYRFVHQLDIAGLEAGRYLVTFNGAQIFDLHTRVPLMTRTVSGEILLEAHRRAAAYGLLSQVYGPGTIYVPEDNDWAQRDVHLSKLKLEVIPQYTQFLATGHRKMVIPGEPEKLQILQKELRTVFGDHAVIFVSKPYFLEVMPDHCGKGEALSWLCSRIGIPVNTVMAFGDSMNDESMIHTAGLSVAMVNGMDSIKSAALYVTEKSNDNDGVADFLDRFVLSA